MVAEDLTSSGHLQEPGVPATSAPAALRWRRRVAFAAALGIVLAYGLRGGGSYDPVVFQEHGLIVWWAIAAGCALGLLPRVRPHRSVLTVLVALTGYAAWTAASLLWTDSSELTWLEAMRSLDLLGVLVLAAFTLDRATWRQAAAGAGLGAVVICLVALGSRLDPGVFGIDRIDVGFHIDRLSRPFGYWNSVAGWGAMTIAICLAWSAHEARWWRRGLILGVVPACGTVMYLTYSRAGIGGAALAAIVVVALSRNRWTAVVHVVAGVAGTAVAILAVRAAPAIADGTGTAGAAGVFSVVLAAGIGCALLAIAGARLGLDRVRMPPRPARLVAITGLVAVLALLAIGAAGYGSRVWHSFTRTASTPATVDPAARFTSVANSRYPLWKASVKAFEHRPLTGTGAGTFEFWWNAHGSDAEFVRDSHNLWLQNLAELGLPGLLLIVAVIVTAVVAGVTAIRRVRRPASAGMAVAMTAPLAVWTLHATVDWMWQSTATAVLAFGATTVAGGRLSEPILARGRILRVGATAAALAASAVALPGILSGTAVTDSQRAFRGGDVPGALAAARRGVSAEPWSASAREQRALVEEADGHLAAARADLTRAIADEPDNYRHWLIRARVDAEQHRNPAAVADLARARRLRPRAAVFAFAPTAVSNGSGRLP